MDVEETAMTLDNLVDSGKVLAVGVSNFLVHDWQLLQKHMKHQLVINQIELSVLHHKPLTDGTISAMQAEGMQALAWSSLAGGRLFGSDEDAIRVRHVLDVIAKQYGCGVDAVAIAWLLAHPAKIMPVIGTNKIQRIADAQEALNIDIDRETWFEIYTAALGQEIP